MPFWKLVNLVVIICNQAVGAYILMQICYLLINSVLCIYLMVSLSM
ncbi:Uncharacterised protein [Salmonella enterica subsp. enterica]|uniref:Uncharacterized protein n=1 Tax=Salmonella enterica I TaxID=59201 RepID=A0A447N835_SALET|nr:Uncharacterised protein [Salmonella enterica subsp. enterica]